MNNTLIKNSIRRGVSYATYRTLIKGLLVEGKSTGSEQNEALFDYSQLNDKRMDRLDKTLKISEETQNSLNQLKDGFTFLVIAEGWCGDAAQILPVINKIAEASTKINLTSFQKPLYGHVDLKETMKFLNLNNDNSMPFDINKLLNNISFSGNNEEFEFSLEYVDKNTNSVSSTIDFMLQNNFLEAYL